MLLLNCKEHGFFIDLAANDPIKISNTRALERDFHWRGVCVEPNVRYHRAIWDQRSCTLVPNAITSSRGQVSFTSPKADKIWGFDGDAFGHIVRDNTEIKGEERPSWTVPSLPFSDVLSTLYTPTTIDYLSLDVEGAEELVMNTFPWHTHNVTIMSVERPTRTLRKLLHSHGYHALPARFTGTVAGNEDTFWLHSSMSASTATERVGERGQLCACPLPSPSPPPPPPSPSPPPPLPGSAIRVTGPCVVSSNPALPNCVASSRYQECYNSNNTRDGGEHCEGYNSNELCTISGTPQLMARPIEVKAFATEGNKCDPAASQQACYDNLKVNGKMYSGNKGNGPEGVVATGEIRWSSDGRGSNPGWKFCFGDGSPVFEPPRPPAQDTLKISVAKC